MFNGRKLPVGIQSFEDLRTTGYLYVDKTAPLYRRKQNVSENRRRVLYQRKNVELLDDKR